MLDKVIDFLMSYDRAKFSNDRNNIVLRCPYCGDPSSIKSANFSIRVNVEENQPLQFQCFRAECQAHGWLSTKVLTERFRCNDMSVILELSKHNEKIEKKSSNFKRLIDRELEIANFKNKRNIEKLNYINNRLGSSFSFKDLKSLRISLDLEEFLKLNNIKKLTTSPKHLDFLSGNSIGFLSGYKDYMICRFVTDKSNSRYYNYAIYKNEEEEVRSKIYIVPTEIDITSPKATTLHVAEGVFTLLGAMLNVRGYKYSGNNIYIANAGAGYRKSIATICSMYGLTKIRLIIYSDSEIKNSFYDNLYKDIKSETEIVEMIVLKNSKKEDFGHKKEDIQVSKYIIHE